jgi:hypothetical protein
MGKLQDWTNRLAVQLYKHLPWLAARWARTHRSVQTEGIPWTPMRKPLRETVIALVTAAGVLLKTQRTIFANAQGSGDHRGTKDHPRARLYLVATSLRRRPMKVNEHFVTSGRDRSSGSFAPPGPVRQAYRAPSVYPGL